MDGTMSQEEINALLNNPSGTDENPENTLTEQEKDAIGEISNISMGTTKRIYDMNCSALQSKS